MPKGVTVDGWLDRRAAADYLSRYANISEWWLEKHIHNPDAPPYIRHGRKVWYREDDLRAWLADEAKMMHVREACGLSLNALHTLGTRRADPPLPNTRELQQKFIQEHGPQDVVIKRAIWERLYLTLNLAQKKILKNKLEVVTT